MSKRAKHNTAVELLTQLTAVLNALSEAGVAPKMKHGAVYTKAGYVLPIDDNRWVARTLLYTELTPSIDQDDDDD